jgi:hypothetical protein
MAGKRQPEQAGGDKGRLEAARIYSQRCIRLARRQEIGNRDRQGDDRGSLEAARIYS